MCVCVCLSVCLSLYLSLPMSRQHMDMKSSTDTGLGLPGVGSRPRAASIKGYRQQVSKHTVLQ